MAETIRDLHTSRGAGAARGSQITRDLHHVGDDTRERIVPLNISPGLRARGLGWMGQSDAGVGYAMARRRPPTGHLVVCHGGRGEVWLDGAWRPCAAGQAYLTPPLVPMAFRTVGRRRWRFAWAYLLDDASRGDRGTAPVLADVDPRHLSHAIDGMYLESTGPASPDRLDLLAAVVRSYVDAIANAVGSVDPLWQLWAAVDATLAEPWTLQRLADRAGVGPESLRRLCLAHHGHSPMRHVTHLRMRRAEALLRSTTSKLYVIARHVGYSNTFAFSTAFRRWGGRPPKACRAY